MDVQLPDNRHLLGQLSSDEQKAYLKWENAMKKTAAKHTYLNTSIYTEFLHDYLESAANHRAYFEEKKAQDNELRKQGVRVDPKVVADTSKGMVRNFRDDFNAKLKDRGVASQESWNALAEEMQGPSILGGISKQFYDSDKGGLQWGGIIGGLVGGFFAYKKFAGGGGWLGGIAVVLASLAGAWLVNKGTDLVSGWMKPKPTVPGQSQNKSPNVPGQAMSPQHNLPSNVREISPDQLDPEARKLFEGAAKTIPPETARTMQDSAQSPEAPDNGFVPQGSPANRPVPESKPTVAPGVP